MAGEGGGNSIPWIIICVSSGEIFLTDFFLVPFIFIFTLVHGMTEKRARRSRCKIDDPRDGGEEGGGEESEGAQNAAEHEGVSGRFYERRQRKMK